MRAMVITRLGPITGDTAPLEERDLPVPIPGKGEILVRVSLCGVCHTELDEIEGRTPPLRLPVIPGHQVVGNVERCGPDATAFAPGTRVGIAWIFHACGTCEACLAGQENLCPAFRATGRDADGGYAEYMTVPEAFAYPLPTGVPDEAAAPLLCAGAIGYRSLRLSGLSDGRSLGLVGFGASAHLVLQLVRHLYPRSPVSVFSRSAGERAFGLELGATWAGAIGDAPPSPPDCIIDTTPAWKPVVDALECLAPGGRLVINAIRKEQADRTELLRIEYPRHLWQEKEIKSVANVTRQDVTGFLAIAAHAGIRPAVQVYPLAEAGTALLDVKQGRIRGAKVLAVRQENT